MADDFNEEAFQSWYRKHSERLGINPNPDDPRQMYDYRAAFRAGVTPQKDPQSGEWHWDSRFKMPGHPREVIDDGEKVWNTRTGEVIRRKSDEQLRQAQ